MIRPVAFGGRRMSASAGMPDCKRRARSISQSNWMPKTSARFVSHSQVSSTKGIDKAP